MISRDKINPQDKLDDENYTWERLIRKYEERFPYTVVAIKQCPFCKSENFMLFTRKYWWAYRICNHCRSIFQNPRPTPEALAGYYKFLADEGVNLHTLCEETKAYRVEHIYVPRWRRSMNMLKSCGVVFPVNKLMEVGAGIGTYTEIMADYHSAREYTIVEPDQSCAKHYTKQPWKLLKTNLENIFVQNYGNQDLIVMNSVIEHPLDIEKFFSVLSELLSPTGYIILVDMNAEGVDLLAAQDQADNLVPYHHLQIASHSGLDALCSRVGLRVWSFWSEGNLDVEICLKLIRNTPLADAVQKRGEHMIYDLQELLKYHGMTGYNGYIIGKKRR